MANRMKEDEKNEKIIRGLLKLPPNRRCINCNNLGPQYVCTNFWTFICTNCSGMHREFTHRVKSVSMAKFTSQEVIALQEGGNERAKLIYFKEWDPQRHSFPDSSNIDRIREFIKHVYVDRRYTGERGTDRPPRVKSEREDSNENRRADSYHGSSRSPPYEDRYDRRERLSSGGRNDETNFRYGYDDRSPVHAHGDYKRSPGHFEGVDERHRDEKIGNGNQNQRIEDRRFPDAAHRASGRSPNYQKGVDSTSPPMVRPVRDILGDDVPPLRVGDIPKPNGAGVSENSSKTQRTASSSSLGSSDGNPVELKRPNFGSLIDFDVDPEPPVSSTQQNVPQQTFSPPSSSDNWASFDIAPQQKASQTSANASSIESSLDQLSTPGIVPAGNVLAPPVSDVHTFSKNNDARQLPVLQQNQPNFLAVGDTRSLVPPSDASMVNSLTWGPSVAPNMHITLTTPAGQPSQGPTAPAGEVGTRVLSQPPAETKPIGRKQLPEDLFTSIYPSAATPFPGWQRPPHPGMGYSMQYPVGAAMQTYSQPPPSINPFDLVNEPSLPHASSFPSMASLQGALPSMTGNAPLLRSASFGAPPTQQYMPPQQPPYPLPSSQSPYLVQHGMTNTAPQAPSHSFPMVNHGVGFGGAGAAFGVTGMEQLSGARHSQPGTPSSFAGGNPFG